MKKFVIALFAVILLLCLCSVSVYAEQIGEQSAIVADGAGTLPLADEEVLDEPFSETVKTIVTKHFGEIGTGISIILLGVLTILYKKGMLPTLIKGFTKLTEILNLFRGNIEDKISEFGEGTKIVSEKMEKAVVACEEMKSHFENLQKLYEQSEARQKMLEAEIEADKKTNMLACSMLYELMMCTNVPQYMKDKIASYYEEEKKIIKDIEAVAENEK